LFHPCAGKSKNRAWVKPEYDLDDYSKTRIVDEIRLANTLLFAIDHKAKRTFAYTCGDKLAGDSSFVDPVRNDFAGARGVKSETNQIEKVDLFDIGAFMVNGQSGEELIEWVKKAQTDSALIVFLFHGVGGGHHLDIPLAEHNKLIRYLKENETEIWVAPLVEVAEFVENYREK
jgi:sialate O-acetylesterase